LLPFLPERKYEVAVHGMSGITAATVASISTNPLDVIKTRLQVTDTHAGVKPTVWRTIQQLLKEEGIRGFGKGGLARVVSVAPISLLYIISYEQVKKLSVKDI